MVAALAVNSRWGWAQSGVQVLPHQPVQVGPQAGHQLELLPGTENPRGAWIEVDGSARVFVDRQRGATSGAFRYELTDRGGPLVSVSATDAQGEPLALSEYTLRPERVSALQLAFSATSEEQTARLFILPETKTVVRLEWQDPQGTGAGSPHFQQWAFEQGAQQLVGAAQIDAVNGTATTRIGGITYHWVISSYAVLDLAYQPGRWLLGVGALLALLGLVTQFVPHQQAWAIVQSAEEGTLVGLRQHSAPAAPRHEAPSMAIARALGLDTEHLAW